jgi:hypothetical protein
MAETRRQPVPGDMHGDWTVVRKAEPQGDRKRRWVVVNAEGEEQTVLQVDLGNLGGDKALSGQITERVLAANAMVHLDGNPFNVYLGPDEDDELDVFQLLAETTPADVEDDDEPCLECGDDEGVEEPFVLKAGHGLSIEEIGDKIYGPRVSVEPEAASLALEEDLRGVIQSALDAVLKAKVALNLATKTLEGLL